MEQKAALGQQDQEIKKKRPKRGQAYILCLIGAAVFLLGAWVVSMMTGGIEIEDPNVEPSAEVHRPAPGSIQEVDDPKSAGLTRKEGFYNFLLVGTDKGGGNTDTILLVSFDTKAGAINMLQIPRDTLLNVDRQNKKINASYAFGKIEGLKKDFTDLLGVPIDRYGILNITGFHKVVDAVGGVEVTVPEPGMYYTDPDQDLAINLSAGKKTLTGVQAEGFVRFRSGYADADLGRLKAQKAFISSLMQKLLTPSMLAKAPELIQIAFKNLKTDLKLEDAVYLGNQATKVKAENIRFFSLPGEGVGANYGIYKEETMEVINAHFNPYTADLTADKFDITPFKRQITEQANTEGANLAEAVDTKLSHIIKKPAKSQEEKPETEEPPPAEEEAPPVVETGAVRIALVNTTANENILVDYMGKLKSNGFTIVAAYSQTDQTFESTVLINVTKQNYGQTLLRYFPAALIQNDYREGAEYDVMILLGEELN